MENHGYDLRPFRHVFRTPLFCALRSVKRTSPTDSRIESIIKGNGFYGMTCWETCKAVLLRCIRDRPMHILDYEKLFDRVHFRYGGRKDSLQDRGIIPWFPTVGMVRLINGEVFFHGSEYALYYGHTDQTMLFVNVAKIRNEELKKPKYKKMSPDEYLLNAILIETKEIINGQARIFRQKNNRNTKKRARTYGVTLNIDGCSD